MPNSKDKPRKPTSKTLSNSLRLKSPHNVKSRQNVSNIINRLPFLRTLDKTQNKLLSITPIWQQWCAKQDHSSSGLLNNASLASIDKSTLTINCKQSSTATILKHQQNTLLDAFKKAGIEHVDNISIQMSLRSSQASEEPINGSQEKTNQNTISQSKHLPKSDTSWQKPSESSLKSIQATQSLIKNEQLAASLKRLADTLKNAE